MGTKYTNKDKHVNALTFSEESDIQKCIITIRGRQVMLDRDLAKIYNVETGRLNEQVKRNIKRFPEDFMFQLTTEEVTNLISHFAISSWGGTRKLPYAFTEQGISMLSGVLRSDVAIEANIRIMRAFVTMRHFVSSSAQVFKRLETIEYHQLEMHQHQEATDKRLEEVFRRLDEGVEPPRQGIFYDGQVYDAYTFVAGLVKRATSEIVLIDNYIDETVLTLLDKRQQGVDATIYTATISSQFQLDISRHNSQYAPIVVNTFKHSHDRFLCIDDEVYHIGASIKDLGKKWFAFSKMEDLTMKELVNKINGIA